MKRIRITAAVIVWLAAFALMAFTVFADTADDEETEAYAPPPMPYEIAITADDFLLSSVPVGMTTNGPVYLMFPTENVSITRNGFPFAYIPGTPIEMGGAYVVSVSMELQLRLDVHHFRVVASPVNDITEFTPPDGFMIEEALFNGVAYQILDPLAFPAFDDGEFRLTFVREDTRYTVTVVIIRTPPQLTFMHMLVGGQMEAITVPADGDGMFEGPIVFAPFEQGDDPFSIQVVFNRSAYNPTGNTLTEPGRYRITVTDVAGNSTVYTFRILYIMDVPTVWIIVIAGILLILLCVYLIHNRVTVRVR
jgi:hypothetical protein